MRPDYRDIPFHNVVRFNCGKLKSSRTARRKFDRVTNNVATPSRNNRFGRRLLQCTELNLEYFTR